MSDVLTKFWKKVEHVTHLCNPIGASIELTNNCNSRCAFCFIENKLDSPELSTDQIFFIIKKLNASGILFLTLTGGDPFLRPDIIPILNAILSSDFFNVAIYTNGTLINNEHVSILKEYRQIIEPLRMTVFSHIDQVHNSYTGVEGGLKKIISIGKKLLSHGVDVRLAMPVMDFNIDTLNESLNYFVNSGFNINFSTFKLINDYNNSPELNHMNSREFYKVYFNTVDKKFLRHSIFCFNKANDNESDSLCRGLRQTIMIDTKGLLHPCISFRSLAYGSILNNMSLNNILKGSETYQYLSKLTKKDLTCSKCSYKGFCHPCLGNWHTKYESLKKPFEGHCNFAHELSEFCNTQLS